MQGTVAERNATEHFVTDIDKRTDRQTHKGYTLYFFLLRSGGLKNSNDYSLLCNKSGGGLLAEQVQRG